MRIYRCILYFLHIFVFLACKLILYLTFVYFYFLVTSFKLENGSGINSLFSEVITQFQRLLFEWTISQPFDMDLIDLISGTLFFLICCDLVSCFVSCWKLLYHFPCCEQKSFEGFHIFIFYRP